jgi:hypothetical protein
LRVGERREKKEGDMISARNQCKYYLKYLHTPLPPHAIQMPRRKAPPCARERWKREEERIQMEGCSDSPSFQTLVLRVAGVTTIPLHPLSLLPNSFRVSPTDGVYEVVN